MTRSDGWGCRFKSRSGHAGQANDATNMVLEPPDEKRIRKIHDTLAKDFYQPIPDSDIKHNLPGFAIRRTGVIHLTKLNGTPFVMNAELIETLEATPDTVITLVTGRKYIVKESVDEVRDRCIRYKKEISQKSIT